MTCRKDKSSDKRSEGCSNCRAHPCTCEQQDLDQLKTAECWCGLVRHQSTYVYCQNYGEPNRGIYCPKRQVIIIDGSWILQTQAQAEAFEPLTKPPDMSILENRSQSKFYIPILKKWPIEIKSSKMSKPGKKKQENMIKTSNLFKEGIQEELKREILTLIITEIEEGYNMSLEKIVTWLEAKEVEKILTNKEDLTLLATDQPIKGIQAQRKGKEEIMRDQLRILDKEEVLPTEEENSILTTSTHQLMVTTTSEKSSQPESGEKTLQSNEVQDVREAVTTPVSQIYDAQKNSELVLQGATGAPPQVSQFNIKSTNSDFLHEKPGPLLSKPSLPALAVHGHDVKNKLKEARKREAKETIQGRKDLTCHLDQPIRVKTVEQKTSCKEHDNKENSYPGCCNTHGKSHYERTSLLD